MNENILYSSLIFVNAIIMIVSEKRLSQKAYPEPIWFIRFPLTKSKWLFNISDSIL